MPTVGYKPENAEAIKQRIDRDMAIIEDVANTMRRRVTDHNEYVEGALEELREVAHKLKDIVDRRTRDV